jgi:hypothetical protein
MSSCYDYNSKAQLISILEERDREIAECKRDLEQALQIQGDILAGNKKLAETVVERDKEIWRLQDPDAIDTIELLAWELEDSDKDYVWVADRLTNAERDLEFLREDYRKVRYCAELLHRLVNYQAEDLKKRDECQS